MPFGLGLASVSCERSSSAITRAVNLSLRARRILCLWMTAVACSNAQLPADGSGGSREAGIDAGYHSHDGSGGVGASAGVGGNDDRASLAICPVEPPAIGAACQAVEARMPGAAGLCTYGSTPDPYCRKGFSCRCGAHAGDAGCAWRISQQELDLCARNPVLTCPDDVPAPADAALSPCDPVLKDSVCANADGWICRCSDWRDCEGTPPCEPFDPPVWYCSPNPPGCPSVIPNAGTSCTDEGQICRYFLSSNADIATCSSGVWWWRRQGAPP
jgi:hypothetical protein